ncbi:hypothetical protein E1B28_011174 [Marasmius oreades]|uniref:Uncharacterized protein n=1 Tax=Marasmius oreades TaxID=181124 RepID=A0A9P7URT2_9AGAR|nr:uncharacterized protein E1B28_011174 [Marasmius oreades]KAG7089494.1 hypothetical protein E1B28_011174 [Marasmius oreades]
MTHFFLRNPPWSGGSLTRPEWFQAVNLTIAKGREEAVGVIIILDLLMNEGRCIKVKLVLRGQVFTLRTLHQKIIRISMSQTVQLSNSEGPGLRLCSSS